MPLNLENMKSGKINILTVFPNNILVDLEIDPEDQASHDDKYTLFCHNDESIYKKSLTVKDDRIEGDEFISLKFENVKSNHNYSLKIDPGDEGEPYLLFEDVPLDTLLNGTYEYEGSEEETETKEIEQIYDDSQDSELPYDDQDLDDSEQYDEESDSADDEEDYEEEDDDYEEEDEDEELWPIQ